MVKVLESSTISPPPSTTADHHHRPSTLPITYFDLYFSHISPVQNLFLYSLPSSTNLDTCISNLKHSLSLTLGHFYPLPGALVPAKLIGDVPTISYNEGDGIAMTIAECDDGEDEELFWELAGNHPREATRFHSLVPDLKMHKGKQPVLAVQVTLFGNLRIGIGVSVHHGVVDGPSFIHFMKTWAFFTTRSSPMSINCPFYDRSVIPDSERLFGEVMKIVHDRGENKEALARKIIDQTATCSDDAVVRATFVLTSKQLKKLHLWVLAMSSIRCSSFTLASAVMWVCSVKSKCTTRNKGFSHGYLFHSNCRGRSIPSNYFGNCQDPFFVELKRSDLVGEHGVLNASMVIAKAISDMKFSKMAFENKSDIISKFLHVDTLLSVAASPRMGVYDMDFGWGRPEKYELVSIDRSSALAMVENKNEEEGGVEMGLVRPMQEMDAFIAVFQNMVQSLSVNSQPLGKLAKALL